MSKDEVKEVIEEQGDETLEEVAPEEVAQDGWSNFAVQILEYLVSLYNGIGGSIVGTNADLPDLYMLPKENVEELLDSLKNVSQSMADEMGLEITWEENNTESTNNDLNSDGAVDVELLKEESNDA